MGLNTEMRLRTIKISKIKFSVDIEAVNTYSFISVSGCIFFEVVSSLILLKVAQKVLIYFVVFCSIRFTNQLQLCSFPDICDSRLYALLVVGCIAYSHFRLSYLIFG
jgi:hypothetical protein